MKIKLSPIRDDRELTLEKLGDALIINGESFDFSAVEEGDVLPQSAIESDFIGSDVTRSGGEIELLIIFPIGASATESQRFPVPIIKNSSRFA